MVQKRRHLAKAFTYRTSSTLLTVLVAFALTGHCGIAFAIGGIDLVIKLAWYYIHERLWYRSRWGIKSG